MYPLDLEAYNTAQWQGWVPQNGKLTKDPALADAVATVKAVADAISVPLMLPSPAMTTTQKVRPI